MGSDQSMIYGYHDVLLFALSMALNVTALPFAYRPGGPSLRQCALFMVSLMLMAFVQFDAGWYWFGASSSFGALVWALAGVKREKEGNDDKL